jgi:hypothetical protein
MKKYICILLLIPSFLFSQEEDLLAELESVQDTTKIVTTSAFKALKIVNLESTKLVANKELFMVISHRFGTIQGGFKELFGLDQAATRIHFIYGLNDWLNVGLSRSSFQKTWEFNTKYRLFRQVEQGFPITVVGFNSLAINGAIEDDFLPKLEFQNRLSYTSQLLISRKFNKNLSLELAPSILHENLAPTFIFGNEASEQENTQYILGLGGRYKISKRVSLNIDYACHLNRNEFSKEDNAFSVGVDIETGGHVFQLHFTNAQPSYEAGFLGGANGDWETGDVFFGFNLSRTF